MQTAAEAVYEVIDIVLHVRATDISVTIIE